MQAIHNPSRKDPYFPLLMAKTDQGDVLLTGKINIFETIPATLAIFMQ